MLFFDGFEHALPKMETHNLLGHRCGWRIAIFEGAYVGQTIGKVTNTEVRTHLMCICIRFRYVCRLTITNNGIHKGGRAAEGGAPTFVEAAEGRLHCW